MIKRWIAGLVLVGGLTIPAISELRVTGNFSADFLKGQVQSEAAGGSFENARAGLIFLGDWASRFSYALEIQAKAISRFEIEQAWVGFSLSEALRLRCGLYLVPFGRYNESGRAFETILVEPPYPVGKVAPSSWRDIGLLAEGKIGVFKFAAYIGNGLAEAESLSAGQQFKDNNSDKGRGGRIGILISRKLEAGFSLYTGRLDAEGTRSLLLKGFDMNWRSENLGLAAEYAEAEIDNPAPFSRGKAEGYFVVLNLHFGGLSPFVAYEKYKYEDPYHGAGFSGPLTAGLGIFENRNLIALGLVCAVHQNVSLKIEYDFNHEGDFELENNMFRAQIAVHF
jgi:hypothetical protein